MIVNKVAEALPKAAGLAGGGKGWTMYRTEWLKHITPKEFALLGMRDLAYVKRVVVDDEAGFAIHAADGTRVALLADRDLAVATIRQHDLEPVSIH